MDVCARLFRLVDDGTATAAAVAAATAAAAAAALGGGGGGGGGGLHGFGFLPLAPLRLALELFAVRERLRGVVFLLRRHRLGHAYASGSASIPLTHSLTHTFSCIRSISKSRRAVLH